MDRFEILEVMEYSQSEPCHLEAITEMGHSLSPGSDEIASGTMMNIYYRSTERAIVTYNDSTDSEKLAVVKSSCLRPNMRLVFTTSSIDFEQAKKLVLKLFGKEEKPTQTLEPAKAVIENNEEAKVENEKSDISANLVPGEVESNKKAKAENIENSVLKESAKAVETPGEVPENAVVPVPEVISEKSGKLVEEKVKEDTISDTPDFPVEITETTEEKNEELVKITANVKEIDNPSTEDAENETDGIVDISKQEGKLTTETIGESIGRTGGLFFFKGAKAEETDADPNSQTKYSTMDEAAKKASNGILDALEPDLALIDLEIEARLKQLEIFLSKELPDKANSYLREREHNSISPVKKLYEICTNKNWNDILSQVCSIDELLYVKKSQSEKPSSYEPKSQLNNSTGKPEIEQSVESEKADSSEKSENEQSPESDKDDSSGKPEIEQSVESEKADSSEKSENEQSPESDKDDSSGKPEIEQSVESEKADSSEKSENEQSPESDKDDSSGKPEIEQSVESEKADSSEKSEIGQSAEYEKAGSSEKSENEQSPESDEDDSSEKPKMEHLAEPGKTDSPEKPKIGQSAESERADSSEKAKTEVSISFDVVEKADSRTSEGKSFKNELFNVSSFSARSLFLSVVLRLCVPYNFLQEKILNEFKKVDKNLIKIPHLNMICTKEEFSDGLRHITRAADKVQSVISAAEEIRGFHFLLDFKQRAEETADGACSDKVPRKDEFYADIIVDIDLDICKCEIVSQKSEVCYANSTEDMLLNVSPFADEVLPKFDVEIHKYSELSSMSETSDSVEEGGEKAEQNNDAELKVYDEINSSGNGLSVSSVDRTESSDFNGSLVDIAEGDHRDTDIEIMETVPLEPEISDAAREAQTSYLNLELRGKTVTDTTTDHSIALSDNFASDIDANDDRDSEADNVEILSTEKPDSNVADEDLQAINHSGSTLKKESSDKDDQKTTFSEEVKELVAESHEEKDTTFYPDDTPEKFPENETHAELVKDDLSDGFKITDANENVKHDNIEGEKPTNAVDLSRDIVDELLRAVLKDYAVSIEGLEAANFKASSSYFFEEDEPKTANDEKVVETKMESHQSSNKTKNDTIVASNEERADNEIKHGEKSLIFKRTKVDESIADVSDEDEEGIDRKQTQLNRNDASKSESIDVASDSMVTETEVVSDNKNHKTQVEVGNFPSKSCSESKIIDEKLKEGDVESEVGQKEKESVETRKDSAAGDMIGRGSEGVSSALLAEKLETVEIENTGQIQKTDTKGLQANYFIDNPAETKTTVTNPDLFEKQSHLSTRQVGTDEGLSKEDASASKFVPRASNATSEQNLFLSMADVTEKTFNHAEEYEGKSAENEEQKEIIPTKDSSSVLSDIIQHHEQAELPPQPDPIPDENLVNEKEGDNLSEKQIVESNENTVMSGHHVKKVSDAPELKSVESSSKAFSGSPSVTDPESFVKDSNADVKAVKDDETAADNSKKLRKEQHIESFQKTKDASRTAQIDAKVTDALNIETRETQNIAGQSFELIVSDATGDHLSESENSEIVKQKSVSVATEYDIVHTAMDAENARSTLVVDDKLTSIESLKHLTIADILRSSDNKNEIKMEYLNHLTSDKTYNLDESEDDRDPGLSLNYLSALFGRLESANLTMSDFVFNSGKFYMKISAIEKILNAPKGFPPVEDSGMPLKATDAERLTDSDELQPDLGSSNKSSKRSNSNFSNGVQALEQNEEPQIEEKLSEFNETDSTDDLEETSIEEKIIAASDLLDTLFEANVTADERLSENAIMDQISPDFEADDAQTAEMPPKTTRPKIADSVESLKAEIDDKLDDISPESVHPDIAARVQERKDSEKVGESIQVSVDNESLKRNTVNTQPNAPRVKDTELEALRKVDGFAMSSQHQEDGHTESEKEVESTNAQNAPEKQKKDSTGSDETEIRQDTNAKDAQNGGKSPERDHILPESVPHDHTHHDHKHARHDNEHHDHKHGNPNHEHHDQEHARHDNEHHDRKHGNPNHEHHDQEHARHDNEHHDHKHRSQDHEHHDHKHADHEHHDHKHADHEHHDHKHADRDHEHHDHKHKDHDHEHHDHKHADHDHEHHDHKHADHDHEHHDHKHAGLDHAHENHGRASLHSGSQHTYHNHEVMVQNSVGDQQYDENDGTECCKSVPRYLRHVLPTVMTGHELVNVHFVNVDKLLSAFDEKQASRLCKMHLVLEFLCEEKLFQLPLWFWIGLCFVLAMPYYIVKLIASLLEEDNPLAVNVKDIERRQVHLLQKNKKLEAVIQSFEDEKNKFAEEHGKLHEAFQKVTNEKIMLERTHEKLQAHIGDSENVCEELKASERELTSLLRQKELELGKLKQLCEAEISKQKSAEENLLHMHGQLASTSATCESLQRQIELLQNQRETQVLDCTTQQQRARELEQTIDTLNHLKNGLEQDLMDLEKTVASKDDVIKNLKHDMEIFKKTFGSSEVKSIVETSSKSSEMKKEKSASLSDGWDADFDEDVDEELLDNSADKTTQLESIFDAAKLKYELDNLKVLYDDTKSQLNDQNSKLISAEARTKSAESDRDSAEKALNEGRIKFQSIEAYLKTTVSELQKQVAELEHKSSQLDKMLTEAKSGQHSAVGDCERYRQQVEDLTDELKRADEKNKKEVSKLQNTAHTAYMEARKLEDKYQSLKHEYDKMRLKKFPKKEPSLIHEEPSKLSKTSQEEKPRKTSRRQRSNRSMSPLDDDWFGMPPPPPMPPFMMGMPPPSMGAAHPPLGAHGVTGHHDAFLPLNNPHLYADPFMSPNYNNSGQYQHESDNTGTDHTGEPNAEERSRQEGHDKFYSQHRGNGNYQYMQCASADSTQYPMPSRNTGSQFSPSHNKSS